MVRTTFIDLNPVELRYHPLMVSLDTCSGSCNAFLPKICIPEKTKDINNKAFNKITNKIDAKTMAGHISCDSKCKFNSTTCNSNQKLFKSKNYHTFKEDYGWNPSTCICKNDKYLKSIVKLQQSRVMKDIKILILIIFSKMKNPTEIF